ncbi:helix-turn-helix transcriptional regulator [Anaerosporobacter sp.]|uniref:helix-turn-helix transcriptional regulator n=1 Tax=Anaerosporobacter sp. TaxID=1872529 RepID=UPI00286F99CD|nr:helix-turn-helix transcriptional regulator [Anaerosporobacter sp.]
MPMNTIIREKRKEQGLTQEQVAEYLGVSTPAVNKWENGITCPDISLLPALARLLTIDLNTLFCFNEDLSDTEIMHFSNEVVQTIATHGFDAGFTMVQEKIHEYPNSYSLLHSISLVMDGSLVMSDLSSDAKIEYQNKILTWYERASKSDNEEIRVNATYMLASKYTGRQEYDKAQEMIDLLPERNVLNKQLLQANIFLEQDKIEEAAKIMERQLLTSINEVQGILLQLIDIELATDALDKAKQISLIYQKTVSLFDLWEFNSFVAPLQIALKENNVSESLSLLNSLLSAITTGWCTKDSVLYNRINKTGSASYGEKMLPPILAELENSPQYDFLREYDDFTRLLTKYNKKIQF